MRNSRGCETPDEALAYVKKHGLKLTDEQLELISGGWESTVDPSYKPPVYTCDRCGAEFTSDHDRVVHIAVEHAWNNSKGHDWTY